MTLPAAFLRRPLAHRGLHSPGCPENSLGAIRAAIALGYGIEIDVQPSADGVPMVFHDYDLRRLTDQTGPIRQRSAAELSDLLLKNSRETIPSLERVLTEVAGRVPLLIEVKDQDGAMGQDVGPLERAMCDLLASYRGPVAVMSFNPNSVAVFRKCASDLPRGWVTDPFDDADWPTIPERRRDALRRMDGFDAADAHFISHNWQDLSNPKVAHVKERNLPILCWTIRSETEARLAREVADNITFEAFLP